MGRRHTECVRNSLNVFETINTQFAIKCYFDYVEDNIIDTLFDGY